MKPDFYCLILIQFLLICSCTDQTADLSNLKRYTGEVTLTTCTKITNGAPQDPRQSFDVGEMAYTHALWKDVQGRHQTTAIFLDPRGNQRYPTEVSLNAAGQVSTWYWLKIAEVEPEWARGKWEIRVFFDGKLAGTKEIIIK
ncbi:MAG: hypothetical protein PHW04_10855 [Candidatus Wallbacteria bacterium]|nr:hypothetical protein [Candidatus Wallbacteria bacterium]